MKFKVEGYTGPNTVFGKGGKTLARIALNAAHPAVGDEVEALDSECREPSKADAENIAAVKARAKSKADAEEKPPGEKVPDSAPPKK